jgi:hypothetical protein
MALRSVLISDCVGLLSAVKLDGFVVKTGRSSLTDRIALLKDRVYYCVVTSLADIGNDSLVEIMLLMTNEED